MTKPDTKPKFKSAAVPDAGFDALSLEEKRRWLEDYLAAGKAQIDVGESLRLKSDKDIDALFRAVRQEAHERAGTLEPGQG